jgi:hypothetical protein
MECFGWTPRDVDELTLFEFYAAWQNVGRIRKEAFRAAACAARLANAKPADFKKAMR